MEWLETCGIDLVGYVCHSTNVTGKRVLVTQYDQYDGDEGFEQAKAWVEAFGKDLRGK